MLHRRTRENGGFTLTELLVVISIAIILMAISLGAIALARANAIDSIARELITKLDQSIEMYRQELKDLPESYAYKPNTTGLAAWQTRYIDWMGSELLSQALCGYDDQEISRPLVNFTAQTFNMPADLAEGGGFRLAAEGDIIIDQNGQRVPAKIIDSSGVEQANVRLKGTVYGPYYSPEKLVKTNTFYSALASRPNTSTASLIRDPYNIPILYYKAQPVIFDRNAPQRTLEKAGATAGKDRRNTGRTTAGIWDRALEDGFGKAPRFDLDHNWGLLDTRTDALRRFLKGWKDTGLPTSESPDSDTFKVVDPSSLASLDYLIICAGADNNWGRRVPDDPTTGDDFGNFKTIASE